MHNKNLNLPPIHPTLGWLLHYTHPTDVCIVEFDKNLSYKSNKFQMKQLTSQLEYRERKGYFNCEKKVFHSTKNIHVHKKYT